MKNKYLVIDAEGNVHEVKKYRESSLCSIEMAICIDREAYLIPALKNLREPKYIKNAKKLGFSWENNSQIGFLSYDYKANLILRLVKEYARHLVYNVGLPIYEVSGSNFFDLKHPVVQAYAGLFGDRLFKFQSNEEELVMSYDASYPQFNLAGKYNILEKHLPFAHFSISDCYRYEQSGECMILFRGRRFNMPDLHPYFKDIDQAWEWYPKFEDQLKAGFDLASRNYLNVAKVSSVENWEKYKANICKIAKSNKKEILVEIKMDGADRYWIVDIDYSFLDSFEQIREIGCIQIDIGNAKRLGINYQNSNQEDKNPVIIHSAIPGGIERYIYMLIDDMSKFPIYFHPVQLRIVAVSEKSVEYSKYLASLYPKIRIDIDDRNEGVSWKIKQAHEEMIPNYVVIGEKESSLEEFPKVFSDIVSKIENEINGLPEIRVKIPLLLSQRIS